MKKINTIYNCNKDNFDLEDPFKGTSEWPGSHIKNWKTDTELGMKK